MGDAGGSLVVQLAYPVDVVFFERRDTPAVTEKLSTSIADAGLVPRLNVNAARQPGEYNVVYSGDEVPISALREVIRIISASGLVHLRSIQPQRHLTNGIQNQIQIGSNIRVACLPVIQDATLQALAKASDADFKTMANNLPSTPCPE